MFEPDPGELVFVAGEVEHARTGDCRKPGHGGVVGFSLQLDGADEIATASQLDPAGNYLIEPVGIADHVGEKPVHLARMTGVQRKTAADAVRNFGHGLHLRRKRGLVDAEYPRTEAGRDPCPAAGCRAEIQTQISRTGIFPHESKCFPKFEIGATGGIGPVFVKCRNPVGEGGGTARGCQHEIGFPQGP